MYVYSFLYSYKFIIHNIKGIGKMKNDQKKELVLPQLENRRINIKSFLQTVKEKKI